MALASGFHTAEAAMPDGVRRVLPAIALLGIAFATRVVDFGNPVIHVDEQYYLLVGDRMLHGALPYVDIWDRKPIGLFLIYAAIRLLPGDGILACQIVATLFAAATAWLVLVAARQVGAARVGAFAAAAAYLVWLPLLSGRGGQSPVFYNLFVTGAAVLTLRLPALHSARAILASGCAACLLAGLAIQTKYTPAVEGAMIGLIHLRYLRRAGTRWPGMPGAALLWAVLGVAPTLAAVLAYALRGGAAFDAFWFANFTSVTLRQGYGAHKIAMRLLGTGAQLAPLVLGALLSWRSRPRGEALVLAFLWLGSAVVGFAMIGAFFDHYALPLVAPLAIVAAAAFGRRRRMLVAALGWGLLLLGAKTLLRHDDAAGARAVARIVERNATRGCPYVFTGDAITYHLAHACLPTRYAFPSTLAYRSEQGATGIDEAAEVRRIMAARPPVVIETSRPLADWNEQTRGIVDAALAREYRPVFAARRDDYRTIVYLRRDQRLVPMSPGLSTARPPHAPAPRAPPAPRERGGRRRSPQPA